MQRPQNSNYGTIEFYDAADARCRAIAMLPPSQHDAAIKALADETGLTLHTLAPIVEKYAHLRIPDYPSLAKQFIERMGRDAVRKLLATGYGQADLRRAAQAFLADQRLSVTGPRLGLLIDAIRAQFQTASPLESIVWGPTPLR